MNNIIHSVTLDKEKCKGCTKCIQLCPTQAIRVRNGKARIIKEKCIDCGECIRVCPYHAKKGVTDNFEIINNFKYKIALPAPAFYGQFKKVDNISAILNALIKIGFDDVFEVAYAAQIITRETKKLIDSGELLMPTISSACPAVVKLISIRFPNLIPNIIPIISPMDLAGQLAKKIAMEKTSFREDEIGTFFISPCAAKAMGAKYPCGVDKSYVDGVFSVSDIYRKVLPFISEKSDIERLSKAGFNGVCWANSGGEVAALERENVIAVDGIHNVVKILEEIENDKLSDVEYAEILACTGGCVGGPLTVENSFVAQTKIKKLAKKLPGKESIDNITADVMMNAPIPYNKALGLDDDMVTAMEKMKRMIEISDTLPGLDCGSCGAPTCRALAEDIVRGYATKSACIYNLKAKILELAEGLEEFKGLNNKNDKS